MSKPRLFLLLTVLLALAVAYGWQQTPRQQRSPQGTPAPPPPAAAAAGKGEDNPAQLDFSGGENLPFETPTRDLFRPLYTPPKVEKKFIGVPQPPSPGPPKTILAPPEVSQPVVLPPPGPKPIPPLKVLGFLQKEGLITVFLASPQGEIYIVRKGERFADGLLFREQQAGQIVISRGPADAGLSLSLGEAKPQRIRVIGTPPSRPPVPVLETIEPKLLKPENIETPPGQPGEPGRNPFEK
jgi:hypothetical protein